MALLATHRMAASRDSQPRPELDREVERTTISPGPGPPQAPPARGGHRYPLTFGGIAHGLRTAKVACHFTGEASFTDASTRDGCDANATLTLTCSSALRVT